MLSVLREDGKALEVGGINDEAVDEFSTRSKELRAKARELEWAYEQKHGRAPGKRARWAIRQQAATKTRDSKDHNPPPAGEQVAAWARKAERSGIGALSALHEAAEAYSAEHEPSRAPSGAERARIIRKAVAAVQLVNATWDRSQLTFELGQVLPPLPADVDPEEYLNGLADEALSGRAEGVNVLQVAPAPDLIDVTRLGRSGRTGRPSTGRRARSGSAPLSTGTMSSTWSRWRCCRCRSESARRPRPRRWRARTWTIPSGRRASGC